MCTKRLGCMRTESRITRRARGRTGRVVLAALAVSFTPTTFAQTPLLTEDAKLLPADGTVGDTFGSAVSIDGNVAIVGAQNDDDAAPSSGSA